MAKAVYEGVSGVARKIKSQYVGVGGVARKVKSGYIGVGGVARQFFRGLPISSTTVGDIVSFGGYNWTIVHNDNQYVYLAMNCHINDLPCYQGSDYDYNNRWKSLVDAMNAAQTILPEDALSQIAPRTITSPGGVHTPENIHSYTGKLWMPVLDDYARFDYYNYSQNRNGTVYTDLLTNPEEHWRYIAGWDCATYIGNVFGGIEVPAYADIATNPSHRILHPVFAEPYVDFEEGYGHAVIWCYAYTGTSNKNRKFNSVGLLSIHEATSDYNPTLWRPHIMIPL